MPIVISMINWKGGVGKTTMTLHLAAGLATPRSKRVLLIDLDAQCNLSFLAVGLSSYVDHAYKNNRTTLKSVFDAYFERAPLKPAASGSGLAIMHITAIRGHERADTVPLIQSAISCATCSHPGSRMM